ncbi:hypothetical protein ACK6TD_19300 [Enterobacter hormaechei]|uniref:hypothetical protein n=1 Tax=Enterobacter hormaechei TaxID=158836 RepID=UPI003C2BB81F
MIELGSHLSSLAVVVGVLAVDRMILRLRRLRLHDIPLGDVVDDGDQFLFPLRYKTQAAKHDGVVQYQLNDKQRPVLVIQGKSFMNWNPFYRLFPFVDNVERTYTLNVGSNEHASAE